MPLTAVLFDHDGTLVDSEHSHFLMWQEILKKYDTLLTEQQYIEHCAGLPTLTNAQVLVRTFQLNLNPVALMNEKRTASANFLAENAFPILPGVLEAVDQFFGMGLKLGVVTGGSNIGVTATLRAYGLEKHISVVVSGDDVTHSKPAPDCYLLAVQQLGCAPRECIAIEDTEHGLAAATAAGIECLAIPTEMSQHHNFQRATAVLPNMTAAADYILKTAAAAVEPNHSGTKMK